jgi:DNA-binding beta-propeller fold protein YncE
MKVNGSTVGSRFVRGALVALILAAGLPILSAVALTAAPAGAAATSWTAYVVNTYQDSLTPIDTATNTAGSPIPLGGVSGSNGDNPTAIAITPNGATAYVLNSHAGTVTPFDLATNSPGPQIAAGSGAIAITPNGATAYVFGAFGVTPIDTATNTPGTLIPLVGVGSIAITPNGATALVTERLVDKVTPIDTATNTAGPPIPMPTGSNPDAIAITPNGATAYIAGRSGTVIPLDLATDTAGTSIPMPLGADPTAIAITPNGDTAYVADSSLGTVTPISTATNTAGNPIHGQFGASGISVTPDGATAYVVDPSSVTPINTATNTAGTSIPLVDTQGNPLSPVDIAITPDQAPVAGNMTVTPALAGSPITFEAAASTVRYGSIASYKWNFGDGRSATTKAFTTTHVYSFGGTFPASVTETSSGGTSTTQVFTGQTMSNNGGPSARASANVIVPGPSIASSYAMTLTSNKGVVYDYSLTIKINGAWSIVGGTGTNALVARGILAMDPATSTWTFTQTFPAASSKITATSINGFLSGTWHPTAGATQIFHAVPII